MRFRIRNAFAAIVLLMAMPAKAQQFSAEEAGLGRATARHLADEFKFLLTMAAESRKTVAAESPGSIPDEACTRALSGFDSAPLADEILVFLTTNQTPESLRSLDAFVMTPELTDYVAMSRRYTLHIASGHADFQALAAEVDSLKFLKLHALQDRKEYQTLAALMRSEPVAALFGQVTMRAMPESCEKSVEAESEPSQAD